MKPFIICCLFMAMIVVANSQKTPGSAVCNCTPPTGKVITSADLALSGKMECLPATAEKRPYKLQLDIFNKTECVLNIQSVTVHGQTLQVPAQNTAARGVTRGVQLSFATPRSQSAPADNKVTLVIGYTLNGRKCSTVQELVYQTCK